MEVLSVSAIGDDADGAPRAKRQAVSSGVPSQHTVADAQQQRSHAAARTERSHGDPRSGPSREQQLPELPELQQELPGADGSSQRCSIPDSQPGLADELAEMCSFRSAGSGSRMQISPSNIEKVALR